MAFVKSVTACICTRNRADFLPTVLDKLKDIDAPAGVNFDVLIVDNASNDDTADVALKYTQIAHAKFKYIYEPAIGLSKARNRGLRESHADIIAFLDDDAVPRDGWLEGLLGGYALADNIGVVGGQVLLALSVNDVPKWFQKPLYRFFSEMEVIADDIKYCTNMGDYPFGANISFRRALALEKGGFDISLGRIGKKLLSGEETRLCEAVKNDGYRILINPKSIVDHYIPAERVSIVYLMKLAWSDGQIYYVWSDKKQHKLFFLKMLGLMMISLLKYVKNSIESCRTATDFVLRSYYFINTVSILYSRWKFQNDQDLFRIPENIKP